MLNQIWRDGLVTIAFAGGGTGGHIYPGLAVAEEARAIFASNGEAVKIVWIGSKEPLDGDIVLKARTKDGGRVADKFCAIRAGKLRRYLSWRNITDVFKVALGFFDSLVCLAREKPSMLFSKGGFVSVSPCAAAKLLHITVFTHECDFTAGLATRLNCLFAKKVLLSYPETKQYIKAKYQNKCVAIGNPVRKAFYEADRKKGLSFLGLKDNGNRPIVLFIGGSLGAQQINTLVEENLAWLCERFIVVHQTGNKGRAQSAGEGENGAPAARCALINEYYHPFPFIYGEMPDVMEAADIVVSRAGANSIWECAVLRRPMVLIPLCGEGTRGDQEDNAKYFAKHGAAKALCGKDATGGNLRIALEELCGEKNRQEMSKNCKLLTGEKMPSREIAKMMYDTLKAEGV